MKRQFALVKNAVKLTEAFQSIEKRGPGMPGMGVIHGETGAGKTTAVAWLVVQHDGIFIRANATWTPSSMLECLCLELGGSGFGKCSKMVDFIIERMAEGNRPLFVDEADYLVGNTKMVETLRDIHDLTGNPVFMIGMKGFDRRIYGRKQLSGRVYQWVDFRPAGIEDARTLTKTVCEVEVDDPLLKALHKRAGGSMRLMVIGLSKIESFGKTNGHGLVTLKIWGQHSFL